MKPGDMFRYIDGSTGLIVSEPFLWRIDLTKKEEEAIECVRVVWSGTDRAVVMSTKAFENHTAKII
jgi:hypothetical protein